MLKIYKKYLTLILQSLAVVIGVLFLVILGYKLDLIVSAKKNLIDKKFYQAVFLSNDQIYFGHLSSIDSNHMRLKDVYYVKVSEDSIGHLVKLGQNEPHGPTNEMTINKEHILFWENLTPDSQVVKSIQSYSKK